LWDYFLDVSLMDVRRPIRLVYKLYEVLLVVVNFTLYRGTVVENYPARFSYPLLPEIPEFLKVVPLFHSFRFFSPVHEF